MAMMLITHDMGVIAGQADRVDRHVRRQDRRDRPTTASCSTRCATPTPRRCWPRSPSSTRTAHAGPVRHPRPAARPVAAAAGLPLRPRCRYAPTSAAAEEPPLLAARRSCRRGTPLRPGVGPTPSPAARPHAVACYRPGERQQGGTLARRGIAPTHGGRPTVLAVPTSAEAAGSRLQDAGGAARGRCDLVEGVPGHLRGHHPAQGRDHQGGRGRLVLRAPRRDLRARRRVRLRQDDARSARRRPGAADLGRGALRGRRHHQAAAAASCGMRRRDLQMMFQDPYASLDPRMRVETIVREPLAVQGIGTRGPAEQARRPSCWARSGCPPSAAELLPARVLRRPAPAHRPGPGAGARTRSSSSPTSRSRALDVSIQAADPQPHEATCRQRHGLTYIVISHDLAVVQVHGRPHRRHVPRQARRDRPRSRRLRRTAHPYTQALIDAIPVPDPVVRPGERTAIVRASCPRPWTPPSGCRFRTRCPFGAGRLRRGGAAAAARRGASTSRRATSPSRRPSGMRS